MFGIPSPEVPPTTEVCKEWEVDVTLNVDDIKTENRPTSDDGQYCKLWEVNGLSLGFDSETN